MEKINNSQKKKLNLFRSQVLNFCHDNDNIVKYMKLKNEQLVAKLQSIESRIYMEIPVWKIGLENTSILQTTSFYLKQISKPFLAICLKKAGFNKEVDLEGFDVHVDSLLMTEIRKYVHENVFVSSAEDKLGEDAAKTMAFLGILGFYNPLFIKGCKYPDLTFDAVKAMTLEDPTGQGFDLAKVLAKLPSLTTKLKDLFPKETQDEMAETMKGLFASLKENTDFIKYFEVEDIMDDIKEKLEENGGDEESDEQTNQTIMSKIAAKLEQVSRKCQTLQNQKGFRNSINSAKEEVLKLAKIIKSDPNIKKILKIVGKEMNINIDAMLANLTVKKVRA